jgi:HAD superfamily hydrolase (TIGR01509 family)
MLIASRIFVPDSIAAILWDMDGVLLDTLSSDYEVCNKLLRNRFGPDVSVAKEVIRRWFPLDLPSFWVQLMPSATGLPPNTDLALEASRFAELHEKVRREERFNPNPGIVEILTEARRRGIKQAVVSNNPTEEVKELLLRSNLLPFFEAVVGNDIESVAKKPDPAPYLLASRLLGLEPRSCAVVEDSLLGLAAGNAAGCFTIGVASGAGSFEQLLQSGMAADVYESFRPVRIILSPGDVTDKSIRTPNDFVSHMVEHIAWRLGCSVHLDWSNGNWFELGRLIGGAIGKFPRAGESTAALGMIDDGSAEVHLCTAVEGLLKFRGASSIDIDWFLGLRCEQLSHGRPLVRLLEGLARELGLAISITLCSVEDPHHSWEGIFRSVGIALSRMHSFPMDSQLVDNSPVPSPVGWNIESCSIDRVAVTRQTAESHVRVAIDWTGYAAPDCRFEVAESISIDGLAGFLNEFSRSAGCHLTIEFTATRFSSSHVVTEDTGLVIGRALRELYERRMKTNGANGAGSSVAAAQDLEDVPVHVGVSVEGRKFWKFVPFVERYDEFRKRFLIGHTVGDGMFSEDLDDFIDGFSGGMGCSVIVHVRDRVDPQTGWPLIFRGLGLSLATVLAENPRRRGLPPGVKGTLA